MTKKLLFYSVGIVSTIVVASIIISQDNQEYPKMLSYVIFYAFSIIGISFADFLAKNGLSNSRRISKSELIWSKVILGLWISVLPTIGNIIIIQKYLYLDNKCILSIIIGCVYAIIFAMYIKINKSGWYFEKNKDDISN